MHLGCIINKISVCKQLFNAHYIQQTEGRRCWITDPACYWRDHHGDSNPIQPHYSTSTWLLCHIEHLQCTKIETADTAVMEQWWILKTKSDTLFNKKIKHWSLIKKNLF